MRSRILLASLFAVSLVASGQDKQLLQNVITVQGSVEMKETADEASIRYSVKGVGSTLREAVQDAKNRVRIIIDKLLSLGVKQKNISTSEFYSGENYGDKAFLSSSRDYKADISTVVKVDSMHLFESVIYAISEGNVETMSSITFSLRDELGMRRRARSAAVMKAREKAEDMTKAAGVGLGKVISIEETQPTQTIRQAGSFQALYMRSAYANPFNPPYREKELAEISDIDESRGSGFFAQTISITSQVRVTFELK